jgi:aryl-alcohol dehydrogenase-like predicted oxidoreductase
VTAPIVGATKLAHVDVAARAVEVTVSADEVAALEQPYVPHPIAGFG